MKNNIIKLLSMKENKALNSKEIIKKLEVKDIDSLSKDILSLEEEGIIYKDKRNKYTLVSNTTLVKGKIKITKRKGPIVELPEKKEMRVVYKDHSILQNHDIVLVDISNNTAKVVKILKREYNDYLAEVIKINKDYIARNNDKEDIYLEEIYPIGTMLLIDGKTNKVKEVLGHKDDVGTKEKEVLAVNGFPTMFKENYLDELKQIPNSLTKEDILSSKQLKFDDLRDIPLVTIDGDDTKDFDDAVGMVDNTIYVSIAMPSLYVKEGQYIWDETLKRGISVYPPGKVNPMFHHILSNGICALVEKEDRYALTCQIKLDDTGKVLSYRINPSIVNIKKRMTYSKVNKYLDNNIIEDDYKEYLIMVEKLSLVAASIKNNMLNNGLLEFTSSEMKFIFDNEKIINIKQDKNGTSGELIEFLMLLNNIITTNYFIKNDLPIVLRNHPAPDKDRLNRWSNLLKQRGYKASSHQEYTEKDIKDNINSYSGSKEKIVLDNIAIRSQAKAIYSSNNIGHFALGLPAYATFTSPIRRLPDFINQKIFLDSFYYSNNYAKNKYKNIVTSFANLATSAEKRADIVERTMSKIRSAEYMKDYIGNFYTAFVKEVGENYIKVLLPNMVVGTIYIDGSEYSLSKDKFSLISNKTSERILVGDEIQVKLVKANTDTGEILFNRGTYREKPKKKTKKK